MSERTIMDDRELLESYSQNESNLAFQQLVERHIHLVFSAAFRQTRNHQLAEDVTQAVFIVLAKKARRIAKGAPLAGWLYRAAHLAAIQAVRNECRRKRREHVAAELAAAASQNESNVVWDQTEPLLDQGLNRLRGKDRDALVLRFFQNKSLKEVGEALKCSEEAAKKRVSRALNKLRAFFGSRSVVFPSGVIGAVIAAKAVRAAPPKLVDATCAVAATEGATATLSTLTLVKQTMKKMFWAKTQLGIGLLVSFLAILAVPYGRSAQPGSVDPTFRSGFPTNASPPIEALALQADGKILIAGRFLFGTNIDGRIFVFQGASRLNSDGSLDPGFQPFDERNVSAVTVQKDGKIIVAGLWSTTNQIKRANITRLNPDGSLDPTFDPGPGTDWPGPFTMVRVLALQTDGKILLGGLFNKVAGASRPSIARLNPDGSLDASFNPPVRAGDDTSVILPEANGKIILGVGFKDARPAGVSGSVFRVKADGGVDPDFRPPLLLRGPLAHQKDGRLIAGLVPVNFSDPAEPIRLVRLDSGGKVDPSFSATISNDVRATFPLQLQKMIIQRDDKIIVTVQFGKIDGVYRTVMVRLNRDGSPDLSFRGPTELEGLPANVTDVSIDSLLLQPDGKILVAGRFAKLDGVQNVLIARLMGDSSFRFLSAHIGATRLLHLVLSGPAGIPVHLEASLDLRVWTPVTTRTNESGTLTIDDPLGEARGRFYRSRSD